jgi:hypothetical protein
MFRLIDFFQLRYSNVYNAVHYDGTLLFTFVSVFFGDISDRITCFFPFLFFICSALRLETR